MEKMDLEKMGYENLDSQNAARKKRMEILERYGVKEKLFSPYFTLPFLSETLWAGNDWFCQHMPKSP